MVHRIGMTVIECDQCGVEQCRLFGFHQVEFHTATGFHTAAANKSRRYQGLSYLIPVQLCLGADPVVLTGSIRPPLGI